MDHNALIAYIEHLMQVFYRSMELCERLKPHSPTSVKFVLEQVKFTLCTLGQQLIAARNYIRSISQNTIGTDTTEDE